MPTLLPLDRLLRRRDTNSRDHHPHLVLLLFYLCLQVPLPALAQTLAVGAIDGDLSVGQGGEASYSLPLTTVPGTNGVEPKLSLVYNSAGGDSPVGVGWMLGGTSAVMRCATTIEQDGFVDGVDYDANDRFCLDGQRLVAVAGAYGADGTEYRTELDSFSRIFSYGVQAGGPQRFLVQQPTGEIVQYGSTEDSREEAAGLAQSPAPVAGWSVSRIEDRNGNYLTYSYFESALGESRPVRIDYTGNATASPELSPYASVRMEYEPRPDPLQGYQSGAVTLWSVRLKRIAMYSGETLVRSYTLGYTQAAPNGRTLLSSVQECAADATCLPATTFSYPTQLAGFAGTSRVVIPPGAAAGRETFSTYDNNFTFSDMDGDGDLDYAWFPASGYDIYVSQWLGTGFGPGTRWLASTPALAVYSQEGTHEAWIDLNGDQKTDRVWIPYGGVDVFVALSTGSSFAAPTIWLRDQVVPGVRSFSADAGAYESYADVNGDALVDRVWIPHGRTDVWVALNTGSSFGTPRVWLTPNQGGVPNYSYLGKHQAFLDMNGDGRDDFAWMPSGLTSIYVALAKEGGFETPRLWLSPSSLGAEDRESFIDVTGDGLPDRVWLTHAPNPFLTQIWLAVNTGTQFRTPVVWQTSASTPAGIPLFGALPRWERLLDLNGDGRVDRLWIPANQTRVMASYTTVQRAADGTPRYALSTPQEILNASVGAAAYSTQGRYEFYEDITGDGAIDKIWFPFNTGEVRLVDGLLTSNSATAIQSGLGLRREIVYSTLMNPSVYTRDTDAVFPLMDARGAMEVVSATRTSDGIGGMRTRTYRYSGLKMHAHGLGNLGMRMTTEDDPGSFTVREFSQDFTRRLQGMLVATSQVERNLTPVRSTENTYVSETVATASASQPIGKRYVVNLAATTTVEKDDQARVLSERTTENLAVDAYGNILEMRRTIRDAAGTIVSEANVTNTYDNDPNIWSIGLLSRTTLTQSLPTAVPASPALTRVTEQSWDVVKRRLLVESVEPAVPELNLQRQYDYDVFGNRVATTVAGYHVQQRTTTSTYDPTGRFPIHSVNPAGHLGDAVYDAGTGQVLSTIDANGLVIAKEYDGFGRERLARDADGTETTLSYALCTAGSCGDAVYTLRTARQDAPPITKFIDRLGREVRTETLSPENRLIVTERRYDALGRNTRISEPYFEGEPVLWTVITYDELDRVSHVRNPAGTSTSVDYQGLTTIATNELGQRQTVVRNAIGQQIQVLDAMNRPIHFRYDAFENLIEIRDSLDNITAVTYDARGRRRSIQDGDRGLWRYDYDALDQLEQQTDAKGQVSTMAYDSLGRPALRVDALGSTAQHLTVWTHDTAAHGVGFPERVAQAACTGSVMDCVASVAASPSYRETYSYDAMGRPAVTLTQIASETFSLENTYDARGRVETLTYPARSAGGRLRVRNVYGSLGHLREVRDEASNELYWKANDTDARGNLTSFTLGNGVTTTRAYDPATGFLNDILSAGSLDGPVQDLRSEFDAIGNLTLRRDDLQNVAETVTYDELNRMIRIEASLPGSTSSATSTVDYDELGNVLSRSDAGTYTYAGSCSGGSAGPHAVTRLVKGSATTDYCYDANGNMTRAGASRTISWSPFDKPTLFKEGAREARFDYNADRARYRRRDVDGSGAVTTTLYVGGLFERQTSGSRTEYRSFIGDFAVHTEVVESGEPPTTALHYLHQDHLGSLSAITDSAGTVKERFSYDPWGQRRNLDGTSAGEPASLAPQATRLRGFTDQEHIDDFALVHMNGRVYDPKLGRFLSADPFVQFGQNLQSYNRYSYVLNNPLSFTDPTGFFSLKKAIKSIAKAYAKVSRAVRDALKSALRAVAKAWAKVPGLDVVAGAAVCVLSGGTGCLAFAAFSASVQVAAGASVGDVLLGAALAYAGGRVAGKIAGALPGPQNSASQGILARVAVQAKPLIGNAIVQGAIAEAQGGRFKDGFVGGLRSSVLRTGAEALFTNLKGGAAATPDPRPEPLTDEEGAGSSPAAVEGTTRVTLRYSSIGFGFTHSYVLVTGPGGQQFYIRAGPALRVDGVIPTLANSCNPSCTEFNGGIFGTLRVEAGAYEPGTVDFETNPAASQSVLETDLPYSEVKARLIDFGNSVNAAQIPYNPFTTNCNAFSHQAVTRLGITRPSAAALAPGTGFELKVP